MLRKSLIAALLASLVCAAGAAAAQAPTVGPVKVFKAGQKTPVDIAGNHLHHGATIRKGTQLLRWKVTMHGASNARVTLSCPAGTKHVGLGSLDHPKISLQGRQGLVLRPPHDQGAVLRGPGRRGPRRRLGPHVRALQGLSP